MGEGYTPPPSAGGGGGAVSSVAGRTGDVVLAESDVASLVADLALKAPLASPALTGTPTVPTAAAATATTQAASTAYVMAKEQAFTLAIAGVLSPTMTDAADFSFVVPWNCTIVRMKVSVKAAVTGAMAVQLRSAAAPITTPPSFGNVTGFVCTFSSGNVLAVVDPADVNLGEGDMLGVSISTGSGVNLLVEVVAVKR